MDKHGDSRSRIIATFYCSSNRVTAPFLGFARKSGTSGDRWESPSFNLSLQPSISTDWDEQSCNSDWEGFFFKKVKPSNPCARGWVIRKRPQKSILWPQMMFVASVLPDGIYVLMITLWFAQLDTEVEQVQNIGIKQNNVSQFSLALCSICYLRQEL